MAQSSVIVLKYLLKTILFHTIDCLVSLVILSATAMLEVLGSILSSNKVLLGFSMKFLVTARS